MKRIVLFVLAVLAISSSPSAQAPADPIATALLGLPANVREGATVIKWKPDQTYDTLQKGTQPSVQVNNVCQSARFFRSKRTPRSFSRFTVNPVSAPRASRENFTMPTESPTNTSLEKG